MTAFALMVFWLSVATLLYAYVGYPLLVLAVGSVRQRRVLRAPDHLPRVSLVIAAYNEADVIAARLDNALGSDYPAERLEIIIASDGSTDATNDIVARYATHGVRLLQLPRGGKIAALNAAVQQATGDVLVFSDANTMCEPAALRLLVRSFADAQVGGVVGHTGYRVRAADESSSLGERLYWRYDTWLKELESRAGSVVSAHGGLYAIRRELYSPPAEGAVTDDFTISTGVIVAGRRLVFEREARAWEHTASRARREFERRVRLMTRGLRAVALRAELLNPLRHGRYALFLFSHKVVRRLVPLALIALLMTSFALAPGAALYRFAAIAQSACYVLAAIGAAARGTGIGRYRCFYIPFFYVLANAAALVALVRFVRGDRIAVWQPQRQPTGAS